MRRIARAKDNPNIELRTAGLQGAATPRGICVSVKRRLRNALILIAGLLAWSMPAAAKIEQAPNSRVLLDLPPGYVASGQFSGFQHEGHGTSIVILEVPLKAYDELASGMTAEKLATRGIRDVARGKLGRADEHVFMRGRQTSQAGDFVKFFVIFKSADLSVLVSANVPAGAIIDGSVKAEEIEQVLASAATTDKRNVRDLYRLDYLGPFKEAGSFVGTSKIYTLDGRMEPERKGEARATFVVAPSLDLRPMADLAEFASRLMDTLSGYTGLKAGEGQKVAIAGMDGIATEATATHAADGRAMRIYQVVLAGKDGGYYRLVGITPTQDADRLMPELHRIAASFRLVD